MTAYTFGDLITFTRASTATYVNSAGNIVSAAINAPRFDYDPVTLAPKGLLIEEQRTNRTLYSEDFTGVSWVATVVGTSTRVNDGAPLGFTRGLITATSATGGIRQIHTGLSSGQVYALSFYIQSTATSVQIVFENGTSQFGTGHNVTINPSNGTAGVLTGFTSVSIRPFGPGYIYTLITAPAGGALAANIEWRITNSGNSIWLGRPQFEAGAFATSYIPTVASQVTRSADVASMTGTNFSSWYKTSAGTVVCEFALEGLTAGGSVSPIWVVSDGTTANSTRLREGTVIAGIDVTMLTSSVVQVDTNQVAVSPNAIQKTAFAWSTASSNLAVNGTALGDGGAITPPAVNQMILTGSNKWLRAIRYYPVRLTNAQLQSLTA